MSDLFKVDIYDIENDEELDDLTKQEFMGWCEFYIHEVVTSN